MLVLVTSAVFLDSEQTITTDEPPVEFRDIGTTTLHYFT